jgi:hypothetical protein
MRLIWPLRAPEISGALKRGNAMSASLVVLLPILLLGIVSVFCFVGCVLQTGGLGNPFTQYTGLVTGNPELLDYWPLSETMDTDPAHDLGPNNIPGQYVDPNTVAQVYPTIMPTPPIFPFPLIPSIANPPGANVQSAAAPGALSLGQPGLVKGDVVQPTNDENTVPTALTTCMVVNGSYVQVPFSSKWNPPSFTLEAWVGVNWTSSDTPALRAVLDGRGSSQGFALIALPDDGQTAPPFVYHWAVMVGNGGADFFTLPEPTGSPPITLFTAATGLQAVYLAATYDSASQMLTLFVNGNQRGAPAPTAYVPNASSPLYIGAGAPYVPLRTVAGSMSGGPLFPFNGAIQDVAIYKSALPFPTIQQHFFEGNGVSFG